MDHKSDVLIDEVPEPITMGEVVQTESRADMGAIEPKVVFNADAIPRPPFGNGPDEEIIAELEQRRDDLAQRITAIEQLIGFVKVEAELAVRVAKIEKFMGIK